MPKPQIGKIYKISDRYRGLCVHVWSEDLLASCKDLTPDDPFLVLDYTKSKYDDLFYEIRALVGDSVRYFKLKSCEIEEISDE